MKGFTLVETLIAITILTLAVAGPLYSGNRALVAAEISRDQLTASYLAQEGIEYVRGLRDDLYLSAYRNNATTATDFSWQSFITGAIASCETAKGCTLDTTNVSSSQITQTLSACTGTNPVCPSLHRAQIWYVYYYSQSQGSITTPFTRVIKATPYPAPNPREMHVSSTVTWSFHGSTYTVTVDDDLTPWQ